MADLRTRLIIAAPPPFLGDPKARPACRAEGVDPEWFFPAVDGGSPHNPHSRTAKARRVCADCPLQMPCADWAADTAQQFGVWGGLVRPELEQRRLCRRGECLHPDHWKATS